MAIDICANRLKISNPGLPFIEPDRFIDEYQSRTTVVLFGHRNFKEMDRGDKIRSCYQHCSLRYVVTGKMTNQSLRKRFSLSTRQVNKTSRIIRDTID